MASSAAPRPLVAIVGAGIGGIATALWLHDLAIPFRWFDSAPILGGTLLRVGNPIDEYPGIDTSNGPALLRHFVDQLAARGLKAELDRTVGQLRETAEGWRLEAGNLAGTHTETLEVEAVVLATGTEPRMLGLAHEQARIGRGVELSVTRNLARVRGEVVAIVGGGDAALEGALLLAPHVPRIHLIHRRPTFRAQRRFDDAVRALPNLTLHAPASVTRIDASPQGDRIEGVMLSTGVHLPVTTLFVRLGVSPRVPAGLDVQRDGCGYVESDSAGRTSRRRLYVVGDCGTGDHQSVGWAVGSAARAVATISRDLDLRRGKTR